MRLASLCLALIAAAATATAAPAPSKTPKVGGYDWTGWMSQSGVTVSGPDCVTAGAERIDCFARGQDGQLRRRWFDGKTWQAWTTAPGVANAAFYVSRPECVASGEAHIECFVRRHGDGVMFRRTWDGAYMHSWENLGGSLTSDPDCVARAPKRIDCFARGQDGAMWQTAFDGDVWTAWASRGGEIKDQTKPACATRGDKIDCLVVWSDGKLKHFAPGDGWDAVGDVSIAGPTAENTDASPRCYTAPDAARIECFAPIKKAETGGSLARLSYDGGWKITDLESDFGRASAPPGQQMAHYDFDCVLRSKGRVDCMELIGWRQEGAPAAEKRARFRHFANVQSAASKWRDVPLTMPMDAGNVTFLKCLSVDGERMDCFTGGSWRGNATLNQASYIYQERITFRPMTPLR